MNQAFNNNTKVVTMTNLVTKVIFISIDQLIARRHQYFPLLAPMPLYRQ